MQVVKKKKKDKTPSKETPKEGKKADKPKVWTYMYWKGQAVAEPHAKLNFP